MADKQTRLKGGKEAYEKKDSYKNLAKKYHVAVVTITKWREEYRDTLMLENKETLVPLKVSPEEYDNLSNKELIDIIMNQDITIERLKKGYLVKGDGMEKEYMIFSTKNVK